MAIDLYRLGRDPNLVTRGLAASRDGGAELVGRVQRNTSALSGVVRRRMASRCRATIPIDWPRWLAIYVATITFAVAFMDTSAGYAVGKWPHWQARLADSVTDAGLGIWYIAPAALALAMASLLKWNVAKKRWLLMRWNWLLLAAYVFVATGASGLIATLLKRGIGRGRPRLFDEQGVFAINSFARDAVYASFPSGHATILGAVAGIIVVLVPQWRWLTLPVFFVLAYSRVVVGAHYPSDVVAGFGFGLAFAIGTAIVFARHGLLFKAGPQALPQLKRTARRLI